MMMASLRVIKVVPYWDMRCKHKLRKRRAFLKSGECLVALNRRRKMARIIGPVGGVHDYYAPKGERWSLERLKEEVMAGFRVRLAIGQQTVTRLRRAA